MIINRNDFIKEILFDIFSYLSGFILKLNLNSLKIATTVMMKGINKIIPDGNATAVKMSERIRITTPKTIRNARLHFLGKQPHHCGTRFLS